MLQTHLEILCKGAIAKGSRLIVMMAQGRLLPLLPTLEEALSSIWALPAAKLLALEAICLKR